MRCLCEKCYRYKFWFEMVQHWYGYGWTCKECAEEMYEKIDTKIKKALGKETHGILHTN